MHFEEFEKASMQELKREAKSCFGRYKDVNTGGLDKPALLLEAQFYMNEMERRHDSWIALRDLLLEIVVILLIGWEIWMSYRGERLQTKDFDAESVVFQNLENSSAATAATLTSLRGTTEAMSGAVQKELELFYDLELTVVYEEGQKKITIENHGRTNVAVWGMHFGTAGNAAYFTEGTIVSAGGGYQNSIQELYDQVMKSAPKGSTTIIPFFVFVKNDKGQKFTIRGDVVTIWHGNALSFNVQTTHINTGWSMK